MLPFNGQLDYASYFKLWQNERLMVFGKANLPDCIIIEYNDYTSGGFTHPIFCRVPHLRSVLQLVSKLRVPLRRWRRESSWQWMILLQAQYVAKFYVSVNWTPFQIPISPSVWSADWLLMVVGCAVQGKRRKWRYYDWSEWFFTLDFVQSLEQSGLLCFFVCLLVFFWGGKGWSGACVSVSIGVGDRLCTVRSECYLPMYQYVIGCLYEQAFRTLSEMKGSALSLCILSELIVQIWSRHM